LIKTDNRGIFDCIDLNEECRGASRCCGSLQCYWADGFSPFKAGKCVPCVLFSETCQLDRQCCSPMVCHKNTRLGVNGVCGYKRYTGSECRDNNQCISEVCKKSSVVDKIKGNGICT